MNIKSFIEKSFSKRGEILNEIKELETSGNLSFFIFTDKSKYILRLCGAKARHRTYEEILSEIKLLKFLHGQGIPVPNPVKINSKFIISINKRNGICYEYLSRDAVKTPNLLQCFAVGKILGKIHNLTANFKYPYKRKLWNLEETKKYFQEVKENLSQNKFLQKYNFIEAIDSALGDLNFPKKLPSGAIHEDLGKRHILFRGNEISRILDWDRSYYGQFILDLGQAIRGWCFDEWKKFNKEKFHSVLNGYESQRKLTPLERKFLLNSIKFAFIERALSFAVTFLNNRKKEDGEFAINNLRLLSFIKI